MRMARAGGRRPGGGERRFRRPASAHAVASVGLELGSRFGTALEVASRGGELAGAGSRSTSLPVSAGVARGRALAGSGRPDPARSSGAVVVTGEVSRPFELLEVGPREAGSGEIARSTERCRRRSGPVGTGGLARPPIGSRRGPASRLRSVIVAGAGSSLPARTDGAASCEARAGVGRTGPRRRSEEARPARTAGCHGRPLRERQKMPSGTGRPSWLATERGSPVSDGALAGRRESGEPRRSAPALAPRGTACGGLPPDPPFEASFCTDTEPSGAHRCRVS